MNMDSLDDPVAIALRSMQITNTLTSAQREALFLQAFPGMEAMAALAPTIVQSHINKIARIIYRAEQAMGVRYETSEEIYLACENATKKLVTEGHKKHGLNAPQTGGRVH